MGREDWGGPEAWLARLLNATFRDPVAPGRLLGYTLEFPPATADDIPVVSVSGQPAAGEPRLHATAHGVSNPGQKRQSPVGV